MTRRISTFSESIPEEEAEKEKLKMSKLGKALKRADKEYEQRKR